MPKPACRARSPSSTRAGRGGSGAAAEDEGVAELEADATDPTDAEADGEAGLEAMAEGDGGAGRLTPLEAPFAHALA